MKHACELRRSLIVDDDVIDGLDFMFRLRLSISKHELQSSRVFLVSLYDHVISFYQFTNLISHISPNVNVTNPQSLAQKLKYSIKGGNTQQIIQTRATNSRLLALQYNYQTTKGRPILQKKCPPQP